LLSQSTVGEQSLYFPAFYRGSLGVEGWVGLLLYLASDQSPFGDWVLDA
jgi:hypothetical protein